MGWLESEDEFRKQHPGMTDAALDFGSLNDVLANAGPYRV
jgi:hypothetical protein